MSTDDQQTSPDASKLQVGEKAPDFTLPTQKTGELFHLHDMLGSAATVLYFYPKDDTPGCTLEACSFRDANHVLQKRGIKVLGISADDAASHQKFAEKYDLPFPLLADTDTSVSQLYGVWKERNMYGRKFMGVNRETFLIDKDGIVRKIWAKVKPEGHAEEVLEAVDSLHL